MPICIECSYPVSHLYSTYSRADDRSLGKGVRLTQCPRCKRFADKYVEYDFVVLFIDLVLIKPQVYRHLLFNRLEGDEHQFDPSIIRLGVLLLLFDVYLTWARIEKSPSLDSTFLSRTPIIIQYLFFLSLNAVATLAHHLTVRLLASIFAPPPPSQNNTSNTTPTPIPRSKHLEPSSAHTAGLVPRSSRRSNANLSANDTTPRPIPPSPRGSFSALPPPLRRASTAPAQSIQPLPPPSTASPTAISTALFVSSCAKLFPILLVIWGPDLSGGGSSHLSETSSTGSTGASAASHPNTAQITLRGGPAPAVPTTPGPSSSVVSSSLLAGLVKVMPAAVPTTYLSNFVELAGSLFTLGAADTHLVLLSNIEALYILLGCGYLRAAALAVAGLLARWTVQRVILGAVGVG
ncbi:hypothetical protein ARAM_001673 [Aspergillus rambellii]|uniref:Protein ARV n=1 Tax=Aspergillus rambellii TaxID=308745 RepID=A0A0F8WR79_9EURO|nr:hypothetical protein ARAM_001673 [Aspergillus rambellii]